MNPQKELQQIQDLSLKLDIPIWKNSIELPSRNKKKYHTFALEKKFFFTWSEENKKIIILIVLARYFCFSKGGAGCDPFVDPKY